MHEVLPLGYLAGRQEIVDGQSQPHGVNDPCRDGAELVHNVIQVTEGVDLRKAAPSPSRGGFEEHIQGREDGDP